MKGYAGQLLFVDLSTGEFEMRPLDEKIAHDFIGGYGIGAKILFNEMPAHADPLGPDSVLGFMTGTLNGSAGFMGGRYMVVNKSPVYQGWNDANSGGSFGPYMRQAGVDGIFIRGIADKPVYLFVDDGVPEIRDASHLWGLTTTACEEAIKEELDDKRIGIALVGPAGERQALTSCIMNDSHRAAGRGGCGAVMGSKMLKAVVVRGKHRIDKADPDALKAINKESIAWSKDSPITANFQKFFEFGTGGDYEASVIAGDASVKNWAGASIADIDPDDYAAASAQTMDPKYKVKKFACNSCNLGCGAIYEFEYMDVKYEHSGRPEYETTGGFGPMMLNTDTDSICMANHLLNEYGIDTISAGGTIAWAMELYSDGVLGIDETCGIDLKWGNSEAIVQMTEAMCKGEGFGAILQHGSRWAANHLGRGHYALCTASGIEIAQHDPRLGPGLARTYIYDPSPGRHTKGGLGPLCGNEPPEVKYRYDDKGPQDAELTAYKEMNNSGGFCDFAHFALCPDAARRMINAVTGFDLSPEEFDRTGRRIFMMRQAFNIREGLRRKDFYMDERMLGIPPLQVGPLEGVTIDPETMADKFFEVMGIDVETAIPLKETLEDLGGLEDVISVLYPEG